MPALLFLPLARRHLRSLHGTPRRLPEGFFTGILGTSQEGLSVSGGEASPSPSI